MNYRHGRLNVVNFINNHVVQKIGVIQENSRPHRLFVEKMALLAARAKRLNVPTVIDYYRNANNTEVLVLERISGAPITDEDNADNAKAMEEVGKQMRLLKRVTNGYGWLKPQSFQGEFDMWSSFLTVYTKEYGLRLVKSRILDTRVLGKLLEVIRNSNLNIPAPFLLHQDLKAGNIMRDDDSKIWIIDWENSILGDPLYDIAMFGVRRGQTKIWESLIKGYGVDATFSKTRYLLYEIIALIGAVEFNIKQGVKKTEREKRLISLLNLLLS